MARPTIVRQLAARARHESVGEHLLGTLFPETPDDTTRLLPLDLRVIGSGREETDTFPMDSDVRGHDWNGLLVGLLDGLEGHLEVGTVLDARHFAGGCVFPGGFTPQVGDAKGYQPWWCIGSKERGPCITHRRRLVRTPFGLASSLVLVQCHRTIVDESVAIEPCLEHFLLDG